MTLPLAAAIPTVARQSSLLSLPNELLSDIAERCGIKHMARLVRCSKATHVRLYPVLIATEVQWNSGNAVIWAVSHGHLDLLKYLHQRGVPVAQHWGNDNIPANGDYYEYEGDYRYINGLSYSEVQDCVPDPNGSMRLTFSLLHLASAEGHDHIISWLLTHGLSVHDGSRGVSPCAKTNYSRACRYPDRPYFWTPLELAACRKHISSAKLLIERGAAVGEGSGDQPDRYSLHVAAKHGCHEIVELLLQTGNYDVNAPDSDGQMLINIIALRPSCRSDLKTLRVFLQAGPDLTISSFPWVPGFRYMPALPLHQAIAGGAFEAALLMLEAGADPSALSAGYYPMQCVFLANGYCISPQSRRAQWKAERLRLLETLLARGADPNASTGGPSPTGLTPLMLAARDTTCLDSIKLLLRYGADVNAVDSVHQQNALQWVVRGMCIVNLRGPDPEIPGAAQLLLASGCSSTHKNAAGQCALQHLARYEEESQALAVVLEHIQKECVRDGCLKASLKLSLAAGLFNNARLLTSNGAIPTKGMVMYACDIFCHKRSFTNLKGSLEFLDRIKTFSEEQGLLGEELKEFILCHKERSIRYYDNMGATNSSARERDE